MICSSFFQCWNLNFLLCCLSWTLTSFWPLSLFDIVCYFRLHMLHMERKIIQKLVSLFYFFIEKFCLFKIQSFTIRICSILLRICSTIVYYELIRTREIPWRSSSFHLPPPLPHPKNFSWQKLGVFWKKQWFSNFILQLFFHRLLNNLFQICQKIPFIKLFLPEGCFSHRSTGLLVTKTEEEVIFFEF